MLPGREIRLGAARDVTCRTADVGGLRGNRILLGGGGGDGDAICRGARRVCLEIGTVRGRRAIG